jgi:hypothetical protein
MRALSQVAELLVMDDVRLSSQPQYSSYFPHSVTKVAMLSSSLRRKLGALVN